ncbi:MAG: preprotein translocase subunit YajC [Jatrophihabitantaceae bacterium]
MYWPYLAIVVLLALFYVASMRNRRRQFAAETERNSRIGFGTEVMTTSGLYGTVVGLNEDDSVQLAIAPGIEVKWTLAALRDIQSLAPRYQQGFQARPDDADSEMDADEPTRPGRFDKPDPDS